jgi:hypothetical protein
MVAGSPPVDDLSCQPTRIARPGESRGTGSAVSNSMQFNNFLSRLRDEAGPKPNDASSLMASGDAARDAHEWTAAAGYNRKVLARQPAAAHVWVQNGCVPKLWPSVTSAACSKLGSILGIAPCWR